MKCLFIQIRCMPGQAYKVADEIVYREIYSELYSTSGEYDLLLKMIIPQGIDVSKHLHDNLLNIEGIMQTNTIMAFNTI